MAITVEDLAAGRSHRLFANAVGFGELAITVYADNLQPPHACRQHSEYEDDDILGGVQLDRRDFFVAVDAAFGFWN